jgi:hypothetical protein
LNFRSHGKYDAPDHQQQQQQQQQVRHPSDAQLQFQSQQQRRIVSGKQAYILGASINTGRVFPYQFEMVNNYLEVNMFSYFCF